LGGLESEAGLKSPTLDASRSRFADEAVFSRNRHAKIFTLLSGRDSVASSVAICVATPLRHFSLAKCRALVELLPEPR
jgi:hypothetical protein